MLKEAIGHCVVISACVAMSDPVINSTHAAFQSPENQLPEGISRVLQTATWRLRSTTTEQRGSESNARLLPGTAARLVKNPERRLSSLRLLVIDRLRKNPWALSF